MPPPTGTFWHDLTSAGVWSVRLCWLIGVVIASNESFGGWSKTSTDPRLCAAIVDCLTLNGAITETGAEPYRLAHTKAQQQLKAV